MYALERLQCTCVLCSLQALIIRQFGRVRLLLAADMVSFLFVLDLTLGKSTVSEKRAQHTRYASNES